MTDTASTNGEVSPKLEDLKGEPETPTKEPHKPARKSRNMSKTNGFYTWRVYSESSLESEWLLSHRVVITDPSLIVRSLRLMGRALLLDVFFLNGASLTLDENAVTLIHIYAVLSV